MQEIVIKSVLVIRKSQLKSYVHSQLVNGYPELMTRVTNRLMLETLIFIKGYASAIEPDIMLPIIKEEVQQLLLEQGFKYIISQIE